jgi:hypothetical protein
LRCARGIIGQPRRNGAAEVEAEQHQGQSIVGAITGKLSLDNEARDRTQWNSGHAVGGQQTESPPMLVLFDSIC